MSPSEEPPSAGASGRAVVPDGAACVRLLAETLGAGAVLGAARARRPADAVTLLVAHLKRLARVLPAARMLELVEALLAAASKHEDVLATVPFADVLVSDALVEGVRAKEAAGGEAEETVRWLLARIEADPRGLCWLAGAGIARALRRSTRGVLLAALEDALPAAGWGGSRSCPHGVAAEIALAVCRRSRLSEPFRRIAGRVGFRAQDDLDLATLLRRERRPEEALAILERGLAGEETRPDDAAFRGFLLLDKARLLHDLGRDEEAEHAAWAAVEHDPRVSTYQALACAFPGPSWSALRSRALAAIERSGIDQALELHLKTRALAALAACVAAATDPELRGARPSRLARAAAALAPFSPALAARMYVLAAEGLLARKGSGTVSRSIEHLDQARRLLASLGREQEWQTIVDRLLRDRQRSRAFCARLEALRTAPPRPSR